MAKIEYEDKIRTRESELEPKNTVRDVDMNEIKESVNALYDLFGPLKAFKTLTDAATITWDYSEGYNATVVLSGNRILAEPTNMEDGDYGYLRIVQDVTGGRTLTLPASFKVVNNGAGAIALSTAANAIDSIAIVKVGSTYEATLGINFTAAP
jgi:hypothetical protein